MRSMILALFAALLCLSPARASDELPTLLQRLATVTGQSVGVPAPKAQVVPVLFSYRPPALHPGESRLHRVQGGECRYCRRRCFVRYRIDCDDSESWCRRRFVLCMRACWEEVCR